jgi:Ca2+-binding RTX toxin-like protein
MHSYYSPDVKDADWEGPDGKEHFPQTPMLYDVLAIQALYGASLTTRAADTVYGFHSTVLGELAPLYDFTVNQAPVLTLFDANGHDRLDLSGYSTPSLISLVAGTYSSFNQMTSNLAIAFGTVIEDATGGAGDDVLIGNDANNWLRGGAGKDILLGGAGDDDLWTEGGNDMVDGGTGNDLINLPGKFADYSISLDEASGGLTLAHPTLGTVTAAGIEGFSFLDEFRTYPDLKLDLQAPTLASRTPSAGGTTASPNAVLVLTMSEPVKPGFGNLVIKNAAGATVATVNHYWTNEVSIQDKVVTIDPRGALLPGTSYTVTIDKGFLTDLAGNPFAGLDAAWTFTTPALASPDGLGPKVQSVTGEQGETARIPVTSKLIVKFDEAIVEGGGSVLIRRGDGSVQETISVTDRSRISLDGERMIIDPATGLLPLNEYQVEIPAGGVKDLAGNRLAARHLSARLETAGIGFLDDYSDHPFAELTPVTVGSAAVRGRIDIPGDTDFFAVDLVKDERYVFILKGTDIKSTGVFLYDHATLTEQDQAYTGDKHEARLVYTAKTSGQYDIYVNGNWYDTGAYSVQVLKVGAAVDDHPNTLATSAALSIATPFNGKLEYAGDEDWVRVTLSAGTTYLLALDGEGKAPADALRLFSSSGALLASGQVSADGHTMRYTPLFSGTYHASVSGQDESATGSYRLTLTSDDHVNTGASATALTAAFPIAGVINSSTDVDAFRLDVVAGTSYAIQLENSVPIGIPSTMYTGSSLALTLTDAAGRPVAAQQAAVGYGESLLQFTAASSGSYELRLSGASFKGQDYQLQWSAVDSADAAGANAASALALGSAAATSGSIDFAGDHDWYAIKLTGGTRYSVALTGARSGGGTLGQTSGALALAIIDVQGNALAATTEANGADLARLSFTPMITQTYYVQVGDMRVGDMRVGGSTAAAPGSYTLQLAPDTSTYSVTATANPYAHEGKMLTFTVHTTGLTTGTVLHTRLDGQEADDFYGGQPLSKDLVVGQDGKAHLDVLLAPDTSVEANDGIQLRVLDSAGATLAQSALLTVIDSTGGNWGSPDNDVFVGGPAADTFEGYGGFDTVRYPGSLDDYLIQSGKGVTEITALSGALAGDRLLGIDRVSFDDAVLALDVDGNAGQVYRLYQAAFDRVPDQGGLGFWINAIDHGFGLRAIAAEFMKSDEYHKLYGDAPSNADFVTRLYQNTLHRAPDSVGLKWWIDILDTGKETQAGVLMAFSESPENSAAVAKIIGEGFVYVPWLG